MALDADEFAAIAVEPRCYVLLPGHDGRGTELVGRTRDYVVVRAVEVAPA